MNTRETARYQPDFFPSSMGKVTLLWDGSLPVEANVVNCSSHGIRVLILSLRDVFDIPKKEDTVRMRINQMWFIGTCVFASSEEDGSISMGIYFYDPIEQSLLRNLLWTLLKDCHRPFPYVSHEWEEFVYKVCHSDDSKVIHSKRT